jgi:predicted 3-demethylubiquinone-9 3-methyltransferase (glyoxalase superfamily)
VPKNGNRFDQFLESKEFDKLYSGLVKKVTVVRKMYWSNTRVGGGWQYDPSDDVISTDNDNPNDLNNPDNYEDVD